MTMYIGNKKSWVKIQYLENLSRRAFWNSVIWRSLITRLITTELLAKIGSSISFADYTTIVYFKWNAVNNRTA